jgi:hypothetical protein
MESNQIDAFVVKLSKSDLINRLKEAICYDLGLEGRFAKIAIDNGEKFITDIADFRPSPPAGIDRTQLCHLDQETDWTGATPADER